MLNRKGGDWDFEEPKDARAHKEQKARRPGQASTVPLLHRLVPVVKTDQGLRATVKGQPIDPASVRRYLAQKFRHELADVQAAMEALAKAYSADQLAAQAYVLYEQFRPVTRGETRPGSRRTLDLDPIRSLGEEK